MTLALLCRKRRRRCYRLDSLRNEPLAGLECWPSTRWHRDDCDGCFCRPVPNDDGLAFVVADADGVDVVAAVIGVAAADEVGSHRGL